MLKRLCLLGILWSLVSCDGGRAGPMEPQPPQPSLLAKIAGDNQVGEVGTELSVQIAVRVSDSTGGPLAGIVVRFRATSGGGSVSDSSRTSDVHGEARTRWRLGSIAGANLATVQVTGVPSVTFAAEGRAGPAVTLLKVSGDSQITYFSQEVVSTALSVRAVDRFANPVPQALVRWQVTNGIGQMVTEVTTSDSSGVATSEWRSGSVAGLANIVASTMSAATTASFHAELRPASLSVSLDTVLMWPGDTTIVAVSILDSASLPLSGSVTWMIANPTILTFHDSVLVATAEGRTQVLVSLPPLVASIHVVVGTRLSGHVYATDGGDPTTMRFFVRTPGTLDSADIRSDGSFVLSLASPMSGQVVDQFFDAKDLLSREYHPSLRRGAVVDHQAPIHAVLLPLQWRIPTGRYAGSTVRISANAAMGNGVMDAGPWTAYGLTSWRDDELPIPVVFFRQLFFQYDTIVTTQDSLDLWQRLQDMEDRVGVRLFRPESYQNLPKDTVVNTITGDTLLFPRGAIAVSFDPRWPPTAGIRQACLGGASCLVPEIKWAQVRIPTVADLRLWNGGAVDPTDQHEFYHALAFSHSCFYPSIMGPGNACHDKTQTPDSLFYGAFSEWPPQGVTEFDVAYLLAQRSMAQVMRLSVPPGIQDIWSIPEAVNGERFFVFGLAQAVSLSRADMGALLGDQR